ncbi:Maf-like protein C3G6.03c [Yarrowia sp. B02]|nr:Maf-like protein C3G6.03c [Yarrowia sp. B02]
MDRIAKALAKERVVLASTSPRRIELLRQLGCKDVDVVPSNFKEDLPKNSMSPFEYVVDTAKGKAMSVYKATMDDLIPPKLVIAADTVILRGSEILEKPKNEVDHFIGLQKLRDHKGPHQVLTAVVCVAPLDEPVSPGYCVKTHLESTEVYFDPDTSDDFLKNYVESGEAKDAAGGYKIQGVGALLISKINGDYNNVIGLPLLATWKLMGSTMFDQELDSDAEDRF